MSKEFLEILEIARENMRKNPSLQGRPVTDVAIQYLRGLQDEVAEVTAEILPENSVYLEDELADIVWDYACVLAQLELHGYVDSAEGVIAHGLAKYTERAPAFLEASEDMWEEVKASQKEKLRQRHEEKYGE